MCKIQDGMTVMSVVSFTGLRAAIPYEHVFQDQASDIFSSIV